MVQASICEKGTWDTHAIAIIALNGSQRQIKWQLQTSFASLKTCRLIGERIPCQFFCRGFVFFRMVKKFDFWAQNLSIGYPCGAPRWLQKNHGIFDLKGPSECPYNYDEIYPLTGRFKEILKFRKVDSLYFSYYFFWAFFQSLVLNEMGNLLEAGKGIGAVTACIRPYIIPSMLVIICVSFCKWPCTYKNQFSFIFCFYGFCKYLQFSIDFC